MTNCLQCNPPVRAVLFDLDGTLVETSIDFPAMRRATLALAARHGAPVQDLSDRDALSIIAGAAEKVGDPARFQVDVEALLQEIELAASANAREMPGAGELLAWLRQNELAVGIVTRNCAPAARQALARAGLACELLLTRADVPRVKPDPGHLLAAAERLGIEPEVTVMVGDHPMDVQAGRAARMRTVGLAPAGRGRDRLLAAGPDLVIGHLGELVPWISPPSS